MVDIQQGHYIRVHFHDKPLDKYTYVRTLTRRNLRDDLRDMAVDRFCENDACARNKNGEHVAPKIE